MLNQKVWPFISVYHDFDVVGQFYGEFLKYTGGDKKALGIVLTPKHITELFSLLANVQKVKEEVEEEVVEENSEKNENEVTNSENSSNEESEQKESAEEN